MTTAYPEVTGDEGKITVKIKDIEHKGGIMMVALFCEEDKFLKEPSFYKEVPVTRESELEVSFDNIPYKRWAVSIYHDLDRNGELNSNALMIPKEPIGFSNEYFPKFGPPRFKNAAFELHEEEIRLTVHLKTY